MKTLISSLLVGVLLLVSATETNAQRVVASRYGEPRPHYVSSRVWVPGRYETVNERVWVEGPVQRVWVEPVYEWRLGSCGFRYVCAREGYWRSVRLPGHYENRCVRVWHPGYWAPRGFGYR
jgi:hypothetical protein